MRYFFVAIAIVAVIGITVPAVYNAIDVEGEPSNAPFTQSTPPTPLPETPRDPNATRTPRPTGTGTAGGAADRHTLRLHRLSQHRRVRPRRPDMEGARRPRGGAGKRFDRHR